MKKPLLVFIISKSNSQVSTKEYLKVWKNTSWNDYVMALSPLKFDSLASAKFWFVHLYFRVPGVDGKMNVLIYIAGWANPLQPTRLIPSRSPFISLVLNLVNAVRPLVGRWCVCAGCGSGWAVTGTSPRSSTRQGSIFWSETHISLSPPPQNIYFFTCRILLSHPRLHKVLPFNLRSSF
jgi:hypothetical protein